jgi:hypothetical protein
LQDFLKWAQKQAYLQPLTTFFVRVSGYGIFQGWVFPVEFQYSDFPIDMGLAET